MNSISSLEREARKHFSSAFTIADSEISLIPTSTVHKGQSVGEMLANICQAAVHDPEIAAQKIGEKLFRNIKKGEEKILSAKDTLNDLKAAAEYLQGDMQAVNRIMDPAIKHSAKVVKAGGLAGIGDPQAVAKQIEIYSCESEQIIEHLLTKYVEQTKSAGNLTWARAKWIAARKSESNLESHYFRRLERLKTVHRIKFKTNNTNGVKQK
jgi:hypothetical protein